jgi:predicted nucleotidyltransferase
MPVRSLSSSVLKWPDLQTVDRAVRRWVAEVVGGRRDVVRIGYFGSYARGDWGVGSDLDLLIVVAGSDEPFERRAARWDATDLPVPADVLVYTKGEWDSLTASSRFHQRLLREAKWLYPKEND